MQVAVLPVAGLDARDLAVALVGDDEVAAVGAEHFALVPGEDRLAPVALDAKVHRRQRRLRPEPDRLAGVVDDQCAVAGAGLAGDLERGDEDVPRGDGLRGRRHGDDRRAQIRAGDEAVRRRGHRGRRLRVRDEPRARRKADRAGQEPAPRESKLRRHGRDSIIPGGDREVGRTYDAKSCA